MRACVCACVRACMHVLPAYMSAPLVCLVPMKARCGCWILWKWSYRLLRARYGCICYVIYLLLLVQLKPAFVWALHIVTGCA